jgi:hypothetical protein
MKKGQVFKAKEINKIVHLILIGCAILSFVVVNHIAYPSTTGMLILGNMSLLFMCIAFYVMIFKLIMSFTWDSLIKRKYDIRDKRLVNSYNLCLKHIENKDLDKATIIFVNAFKGKNNKYEDILRVAIKAANNYSLNDEYLKYE